MKPELVTIGEVEVEDMIRRWLVGEYGEGCQIELFQTILDGAFCGAGSDIVWNGFPSFNIRVRRPERATADMANVRVEVKENVND